MKEAVSKLKAQSTDIERHPCAKEHCVTIGYGVTVKRLGGIGAFQSQCNARIVTFYLFDKDAVNPR